MILKAFFSICCVLTIIPAAAAADMCPTTLDFDVRQLADEKQINLCEQYLGKVVLVVNTASKCGFTPQYEGLEALYREYRDRGLVVLGFPSNDFGGQEPGNEAQVQKFCRLTYGVEFPMFAKTRVRPPASDPLYRALSEAAGEAPAWNFHKYLLDRQGKLVGSYPSRVEPRELSGVIESLL